MDVDTKEINKISFGILSSEEIKRHAVAQIEHSKIKSVSTMENFNEEAFGTLYDPRLGSTCGKCVTCDLDSMWCPGHTGYIDLVKPVVNPIFISHVAVLLKFFCRQCHKFTLDQNHLNLRGFEKFKEKRRFLELVKIFTKTAICIHCNYIQPDYKIITVENFSVIHAIYNNNQICKIEPEECLERFENISHDEIRLIGFDPKLIHPKDFILTRFPVIPTCCRPYVVNEGNVCDDDLTYQLLEIIKNNILIKDSSKDERKYYNNLLFRIMTYFNNSSKKAKHATTGRPIKGIKERIGGKDGHIRNNLLGKRVNQSARTVIGPDPNIDMETLIVPKYMADILTYPEIVYDRNIEKLNELLKNNHINYILKKNGTKVNVGKSYNSYIIQHGDVVVYNNQKRVILDTKKHIPELDSGQAYLLRNDTKIQLEPIQPIVIENGDVVYRKLCDGDYVMLNRQPTLHKASMMALKCKIANVKTLKINLAISKPFNCDFDGDEMNIHVPQSLESRIELEMLSTPKQCMINTQAGKPNMAIVQDSLTAMYLISSQADRSLKRQDYFQIVFRCKNTTIIKDSYTFRDIINTILPKNYNFKSNDLEIENGRLLKGVLNKKYLGNTKSSLIKSIYFCCGIEACVNFINDLQFSATEWLYIYGFTIHAEDCLTTNSIDKSNLFLNSCLQQAELYSLTIQHEHIKENKIISCLSKAKDIGMKIAKNHLRHDNNFITTVESGSKGDYFNIAQITGLLGQQIICNGRISGTMNNNQRCLVNEPFQKNCLDKYKFKGFIVNSFEEGLDPIEFFFHSISGRKGVSDTALSTATSGYNMRRIVKLTEDISIQYDGTVRDTNKRLYQTSYNNNFDPTKLYKNKFFYNTSK